jgi:hypothetical protein
MHDEVEAVIDCYLVGLYTGDVRKLRQAFHPNCQLHSLDSEGAVAALPRDAWLELVAQRQSPQAMGHAREQEILSVDIANSKMAAVKLKFTVPQRCFTDFLLLLNSDEGWRIIAKSYTIDSHEA